MEQMSLTDALTPADKPGITGDYMAKQAFEWTVRNFHAWSEMKRIAVSFIEQGRHFSIAYLVEEARYNMRLKGSDDGFKVNHNIRAALARLLVKEIPAAKPYIELRSSKVDWV